MSDKQIKKVLDALTQFMEVDRRIRNGSLRLHGRTYKRALADLRAAYEASEDQK